MAAGVGRAGRAQAEPPAAAGFLLTDQATWRDLLWTIVDISAACVLTLAPAGLIALGLFGVVMPAVWHPIAAARGNNWYAAPGIVPLAGSIGAAPLGRRR